MPLSLSFEIDIIVHPIEFARQSGAGNTDDYPEEAADTRCSTALNVIPPGTVSFPLIV
jgi:hypothetical protein